MDRTSGLPGTANFGRPADQRLEGNHAQGCRPDTHRRASRDGYREPISEETIRRAIRLGDYYTAHTLAAFGAMSTGPHLGLAGDLLGWLYPDGTREYRTAFSQRDAHRRFQDQAAMPPRPLAISAVRDRIVRAAVKIVLEPVFEADFLPCSFGFRPGPLFTSVRNAGWPTVAGSPALR